MLPVQLFEQPLYKLHLDLVTKPKVYVGKFSTYGNDVTPGFINRLGTCSSLCAINFMKIVSFYVATRPLASTKI